MKIIARNKKALHDYQIEKKIEAGLVLTGTEVKSLRAGKVGFADSFARIKDGEAYLFNLNIPYYEHSGIYFNHDPKRRRKLLLHRIEIDRLRRKINESGYTLVPLSIYFNDSGIAKIELGLAKGKRKPDKKDYLLQKQKEREMDRARKDFERGKY